MPAILNPLAGRNRIEGAVVMGIGMALLEHTHYDPQNGAPINSNLADYMMAVNADVPPIDVHFLDYPDKEINELGARGIGEIGEIGLAAAITAATYHATGVRVRELPIKIEHLLTSSIPGSTDHEGRSRGAAAFSMLLPRYDTSPPRQRRPACYQSGTGSHRRED